MAQGALGKTYQDGNPIVLQGEVGDCMYVVQAGQVDVVIATEDREEHLAVLGAGDFFGEMALFVREVRSATVRAKGEARVLKIDKKTLLRRITEDPLLAVRFLETLSHRIQALNIRCARLEQEAR